MDELKNTHYDAFISYRHSELDSFVAENLHRRLENFKLPKSVRSKIKDGKTSIERVFRDVDELPLSDNLSEPITNALANSEYLITLCTPRYPQSRWCLKEIETFLQTHPRDHILVVLAEGEPVDSFPEILTYEQIEVKDEKGNVHFERKQIEPLAADTRGGDKKEILKAMDVAVIKLCAAMFGLNYDDLKQRHREQKMRRMMTVFGIIGAFMFCFAAVVTGMLIKISRQNSIISSQYSELSDKYADTIADKAEDLLGHGRRKDAVYALRSVLPDDPSDGYNANALRVLYKAMGIYADNSAYNLGAAYDMGSEVYDYCVSDNGRYILINDLYSLRLFDISGELIREFPGESNNFFAEGIICGNNGVVHTCEDELRFYFIDEDRDVTIAEPGEIYYLYEVGPDTVIVYNGNELIAVSGSGDIIYTIDTSELFGSDDLSITGFSSGNGLFACSLTDYSEHHLMIADLHSGEVTDAIDVASDYNVSVCISDEYLYYSQTESADGSGLDKVTLHAVRPHGGREQFSVKIDRGIINDLWVSDGYIYAYTGSGLTILEARTGKEITTYGVDGEIQYGINVSDHMIFLCDTGSIYGAIGDMCYEMGSTLFVGDHSGRISRMIFKNNSYYVQFERADYICAYHPAVTLDGDGIIDPDFDDLYGEDATFDLQEDDRFDSLLLDQAVYSHDGKYIVASFSNHTVRIFDADTYECVASYDLNEYVLSLIFSDVTDSYILDCENTSFVLNKDLDIICEMGSTGGEYGGRLLVCDRFGEFRSVEWVDYEKLMAMADEYLGDYVPRDSIREKYGLQ